MIRATAGLLILVGLCLAASAVTVAVAQEGAEEKRLLKAAFIYNFAKFTRWPENAWAGPEAPLTLCTAGEDELVDALRRLGGKRVKGRRVDILPLEDAQVPKQCHVLYIATSERGRDVDLVESVRNAPVLTVSEIPHFGRSGGIIALYHEKDRIRFIINQGAARRAGLKLNSRLLNLAIVVDH